MAALSGSSRRARDTMANEDGPKMMSIFDGQSRLATGLRFGVPFRSVPRRSPAAACDRVAALAQTLVPLLEDAADAGARKSSRGLEFVGRAKGIPTRTRPARPPWTRPGSQMRRAVRRAGFLVDRAEARAKK